VVDVADLGYCSDRAGDPLPNPLPVARARARVLVLKANLRTKTRATQQKLSLEPFDEAPRALG